jgi:hypothetical protein
MGISILKIELKILSGEEESSNDPNPPFKEKEKEGEGRSKAWWPKEGEGEGSHAWRPMKGEVESSHVWRLMEGEGKILFTSSHFPPNQFFPLTLRFYFSMVLNHYSHISSLSSIYKL